MTHLNSPDVQPKRRISTFTIEQVVDALASVDISYRIDGNEVGADIDGCGRHHVKINPRKGVWFDAADPDKRGTVAGLLYKIGTQVRPTSAIPEQSNVAPIHKKKDTQKRAVAIWKSAWLCINGSLPPAWNDGLNSAHKGALRVRLEHYRKVVRAYLTDRLGAEHLDHWMQQIRITTDHGLMLTPMSENGVIVGIQRTFFDDAGGKAERKMLGHHGVQVLPPPDSVPHVDLGTGSTKNRIIGEGFETVAAVVQASGWTGIACHFDGGIVKYARSQVAMAKTLTQEQIATAATSIILVDRDVSQAGQKAVAKAVRILREAGLQAFYAIPPVVEHGGPVGGEKGSDWGDYPREGLSGTALAAHLALAVANSDRDMPPAPDDEYSEPSQTSYSDGWHDAVAPESVAESRPVAEVRGLLQTELQKTVDDYLEWLSDETPAIPTLMMPTTGTGKTSAVKSLVNNQQLNDAGGRVCVFVPDHKQATEYEHAGFFHFYGRNPEPDHVGYCPNHQSLTATQEKNHIAQSEFCKRCPNGHRWAIDVRMNRDPNDEKIEKLQNRLTVMGLDWNEITPCTWQSHLRDAMDSRFVVAASGSYSHSLAGKSLVILDEHFDVGKGIQVTLQDIDGWAKRNQRAIDVVEHGGLDYEDIDRHKQAGEFFQILAAELARWVGKTGSVCIDEKLTSAANEIVRIVGEVHTEHNWTSHDADLFDWESLKFNICSGQLEDIPLKAAAAIAETLKHGDGYVEDGVLVIAASLPVINRIGMGLPTVVMDATPDPVITDVVGAADGRIIHAIATQNVQIRRYPTRFWGLTALNEKVVGKERSGKEAAKYKALIDHHFTPDTAYLLHARAYDAVGFNDVVSDANGQPASYAGDLARIPLGQAGYWGGHHRAHDGWTGKELVMVGSFYPPASAVRGMYQVSRIAALSAGAKPENWPVWPDSMQMVQGDYICEGGMDVKCHLPLPSDPHIRGWLLAKITSETVQAIGRARGANADQQITVHIYGGVPLAGLGQHGLSVAVYDSDPASVGQTIADYHADRHATSLSQCDVLASRLIAQGKPITRDAMSDELYSYRIGIGIHTDAVRIETDPPTMPRPAVIQEWIKTRLPILSSHMSTRGQGGKKVKEARAAADAFSESVPADDTSYSDRLVDSPLTDDDLVSMFLESMSLFSADDSDGGDEDDDEDDDGLEDDDWLPDFGEVDVLDFD